MKMLFDRWENLTSASAIVLIDELDAHLHPRWKMRIVSSLRKAFPQVQFVASTHDPLVLRGIRNNEVAVLRRVPGQGTVIDQELPPIEGMNVEDLLTSRHFGLDSLLDPDVEARLTELYHLRSLPQTSETARRLEELRSSIGDREALGSNRREQIALQATDEFLRTAPNRDSAEMRKSVSTATVSRLQALLDITRNSNL
jgi:predicted ATP-binding protein involved in virulence